MAPLSGVDGVSLQYGLHLYLRPLTVESIRSAGQAQLARIADDGMAARRLGGKICGERKSTASAMTAR